MRYTGKLFHPPDAALHLDLAALSPIQGRLAYDVFAQLKTRMDQDLFSIEVDPSPTFEPLTLSFRRSGKRRAWSQSCRPAAVPPMVAS